MKKVIFTFCAFAFLLITSCSKDSKTVAPGITAAQVNTIITNGSWRVSSYKEAGIDNTSDFSGYSFVFNTVGTLVATGAITKTGTWNSTTDSGSVKIPIAFPDETDGPFKSISDDWIVTSATNLKLELKHTSSDDGSTDLMTLEKN